MIDPQLVRKDYPIYQHNGKLVYLDSTATALKPQVVIDALDNYYSQYSANVHRGIYALAEKATNAYDSARIVTADFLHTSREKVIFTSGTTDGINLLAYSWGRTQVTKKDEIVVSIVEHHSNFVPWQQLALETGAQLKIVYPDERGIIPFDDGKFVDTVISKKTKAVCLYFVSNVLGTINPLKKIIENIKKKNPQIFIFIDGAQAAPTLDINVETLGCYAFVFSGHKVGGPTGIGVLWVSPRLLDLLPPFRFGGEMIQEVHIAESIFKSSPEKFEAGTPHIAGAIGLAAALEYKNKYKSTNILNHERKLATHLINSLNEFPHIKIIGPQNTDNRVGIISFVHDTIHAHDIGQVCAQMNVCVRVGHHCTMPLHEYYGIPASIRASLYIYNSIEDIDQLVVAIRKAEKLFL